MLQVRLDRVNALVHRASCVKRPAAQSCDAPFFCNLNKNGKTTAEPRMGELITLPKRALALPRLADSIIAPRIQLRARRRQVRRAEKWKRGNQGIAAPQSVRKMQFSLSFGRSVSQNGTEEAAAAARDALRNKKAAKVLRESNK